MGMDVDIDPALAKGLRRYVDQIAEALALTGRPYRVDLDRPMNAYVALDTRLSSFPEYDIALLWNEQHGWAGALETGTNSELTVLAYLGKPLLPSPHAVAQFAYDFLAERFTRSITAPTYRAADRDALTARLLSSPLLIPVSARAPAPTPI